MSHYEMHAYIDPRADRIDSMCVQTSSSVATYMPELAERAGLGEPRCKPVYGRNLFENGEIHVKRVTDRECS